MELRPPERGISRSDLRKVWNSLLFVLTRGCRWINKSRTKEQKNKTLYQRPSHQESMTLELPQGRNAKVLVVIAVVGDEEASRGEAPNNHLIALNILLTAYKGPWTIAK